eukprot:TRINITY_DN1066_c0_g1_i1.p1 TRINITY_DN1066_c0_g1~~TRINITY_DN1066_c0_g1_i1.p1  ORF type:complete len:416 (-),score=103.12 TRINITY_DN1066_c0_g1_i1:17-1264(-)
MTQRTFISYATTPELIEILSQPIPTTIKDYLTYLESQTLAILDLWKTHKSPDVAWQLIFSLDLFWIDFDVSVDALDEILEGSELNRIQEKIGSLWESDLGIFEGCMQVGEAFDFAFVWEGLGMIMKKNGLYEMSAVCLTRLIQHVDLDWVDNMLFMFYRDMDLRSKCMEVIQFVRQKGKEGLALAMEACMLLESDMEEAIVLLEKSESVLSRYWLSYLVLQGYYHKFNLDQCSEYIQEYMILFNDSEAIGLLIEMKTLSEEEEIVINGMPELTDLYKIGSILDDIKSQVSLVEILYEEKKWKQAYRLIMEHAWDHPSLMVFYRAGEMVSKGGNGLDKDIDKAHDILLEALERYEEGSFFETDEDEEVLEKIRTLLASLEPSFWQRNKMKMIIGGTALLFGLGVGYYLLNKPNDKQ